MATKLPTPIKHYKTHTTTKIHGETIPTVILARSHQDQPVPVNLVRLTNVGLPSSSSTLVVLTW